MARKVLIALTNAMVEDADRIADREHRSRSELVREAIRQYIEKDDLKQATLNKLKHIGSSEQSPEMRMRSIHDVENEVTAYKQAKIS